MDHHLSIVRQECLGFLSDCCQLDNMWLAIAHPPRRRLIHHEKNAVVVDFGHEAGGVAHDHSICVQNLQRSAKLQLLFTTHLRISNPGAVPKDVSDWTLWTAFSALLIVVELVHLRAPVLLQPFLVKPSLGINKTRVEEPMHKNSAQIDVQERQRTNPLAILAVAGHQLRRATRCLERYVTCIPCYVR